MLSDLLTDLKNISIEYDAEIPPINNTKELKRKLTSQFPEELAYFPNGKYVIVHPSDIIPCEYSVATLKGHLQVYYWLRLFLTIIETYGWQNNEDDKIEPIWFTGSQLPSSIGKSATRKVHDTPMEPPIKRRCLQAATENTSGENSNSKEAEDLGADNIVEGDIN